MSDEKAKWIQEEVRGLVDHARFTERSLIAGWLRVLAARSGCAELVRAAESVERGEHRE